MSKKSAPSRKRVQKKSHFINFDKYDLYMKSVQSPDADAEFLRDTYKDLKGKKAQILREDFCGTFALSCEWVKLNSKHLAWGVDLDPEPVDYGRRHLLSKLKPPQQNRLHLVEGDVLDIDLPEADISLAVNFSYFIFKSRQQMKKYFQQVLKSLKKDGLFFIDVFGGGACQDAAMDIHKFKGFSYRWEQVGFDPISNEALFYIHFTVGSKKIKKVFSYDWRLWTIPELRELMDEVGFKKTHVYWEGTNRKGEGNGVFTRTEQGEPCDSWIAYIVAEK